ncbi:MAG: Serine phosphatase RsbU, regulator of sigma subunit, partial [uncultured Blastococcus sp.]
AAAGPGARLGHHAAGPPERLVQHPPGRGQYLSELPLPDAPDVGPGARHALQRRVRADARRPAPVRAGPARRGGLGRHLARPRTAGGRGDGRPGDLLREPAAGHVPVRVPGGDLLLLLLQPGGGTRRAGRGSAGHGRGDHSAGAVHPAPRRPATTGQPASFGARERLPGGGRGVAGSRRRAVGHPGRPRVPDRWDAGRPPPRRQPRHRDPRRARRQRHPRAGAQGHDQRGGAHDHRPGRPPARPLRLGCQPRRGSRCPDRRRAAADRERAQCPGRSAGAGHQPAPAHGRRVQHLPLPRRGPGGCSRHRRAGRGDRTATGSGAGRARPPAGAVPDRGRRHPAAGGARSDRAARGVRGPLRARHRHAGGGRRLVRRRRPARRLLRRGRRRRRGHRAVRGGGHGPAAQRRAGAAAGEPVAVPRPRCPRPVRRAHPGRAVQHRLLRHRRPEGRHPAVQRCRASARDRGRRRRRLAPAGGRLLAPPGGAGRARAAGGRRRPRAGIDAAALHGRSDRAARPGPRRGHCTRARDPGERPHAAAGRARRPAHQAAPGRRPRRRRRDPAVPARRL